MLKERRGITYLCPLGEKSGTRGSNAAAHCLNHRLLSSRTCPNDSLAFTHLRPSDHFAAAVFFSPFVPRTYLSTLGPICEWFFSALFFIVLGALSFKNNRCPQSWRRNSTTPKEEKHDIRQRNSQVTASGRVHAP